MSRPRPCKWHTTCSMLWQSPSTTLSLSTRMLLGERSRRQKGPAVTASCGSPCPCSSTRCAHTRLTQWTLSRCVRTACRTCVISWTSLLGRFGVVGCDTCLIVKAHCQALSAQALLRRRDWDMASLDTPCPAVLEHLVQAGWSVGKGPTAHTPVSPRVFTWREDMPQKPYWQCLATLVTMFCERFAAVPVGSATIL